MMSTLIIYTPAIPKDSVILNFFTKKGLAVKAFAGIGAYQPKQVYGCCCRHAW
jgi:hypothetical protein